MNVFLQVNFTANHQSLKKKKIKYTKGDINGSDVSI